jgi:hypothetical protein
MLELPRSELLVGVVSYAIEGVRPYVCCAADLERSDLNVIGVDQEEELA